MDMYCGMSEYIDDHLLNNAVTVGKKAKVREQIESVIAILYKVDDIAHYLDQKKSKIGIFGYRAKDAELFANVPKKVNNTMNSFLIIQKALNKRRLKLPMSHDFQYVMNEYPKVFQW